MMRKLFTQNNIVMMCFAVLVMANHRLQTGAWYEWQVAVARDISCVALSTLVISCFKWEDITAHRICYGIWCGIGLITAVLCMAYSLKTGRIWEQDAVVIAVGFFLLGICYIHLFFELKGGNFPGLYPPMMILWTVMMIWMILFRTDEFWPIPYFCMFFVMYMTKMTIEQRHDIYRGLLNGIILALILNQGYSMLFRPYDILRYLGNYSNPNHNSAFLCVCFGAIMGRFLLAVSDKENPAVRIILGILGGHCGALILMTVCRSGYFLSVVCSVVFAIAMCNITGKKIFFRTSLIMLLVIIVSFPFAYLAVRYIPLTNPYVKYYSWDNHNKHPISSDDKYDSDAYVEFKDIVSEIYLRMGGTVTETSNLIQDTEAVKEHGSEKNPTYSVRYTIYKWYIDHLHWRGVPVEEQGFQITEEFYIGDTHDIFLDYGINFGWPAMLMFMVLSFWAVVRSIYRAWKNKNAILWIVSIFLLMPITFGIFEYFFGVATIYSLLPYFCYKEAMSTEGVRDEEV